ncbi:hypothetical protein AB0B25_07655 [Nocardia sp. NPDC049190]|uniref:hypothetical protein n=1 Tax=Nocardia sp. NPDC049190 TaxID=3155650 RepID=UPI0033C3F4B2
MIASTKNCHIIPRGRTRIPYTSNLASILIRLRDIDDHRVIASTDGHRVRLLIRDADNPDTDWRYADLDPDATDSLAAALTIRHRPRPIRWAARWLPVRSLRR